MNTNIWILAPPIIDHPAPLGWCNVVRWTTPEQCCYQGSTTLVELTMLMSIVRSIVVRSWQRTISVTMLLSRFNNTCWIHNVDEYCSMISCSMLTKNNSCYNVVRTWADNSWWKKLVDRCQQWLYNGCWTWTTVNNGCWQQLLTGCSTTLQQVVDNIDQVIHFCACT